MTILISSHILDELSKLATHYGFIDHGRMIKEISAPALEASCRKCVVVEVSDIRALCRVLDKTNLEYCVQNDNTADIYAKVNITKLVMALAEENCEILSIKERDESLESYYVNLVGGESHA